jgi:hypothetical protein
MRLIIDRLARIQLLGPLLVSSICVPDVLALDLINNVLTDVLGMISDAL